MGEEDEWYRIRYAVWIGTSIAFVFIVFITFMMCLWRGTVGWLLVIFTFLVFLLLLISSITLIFY